MEAPRSTSSPAPGDQVASMMLSSMAPASESNPSAAPPPTTEPPRSAVGPDEDTAEGSSSPATSPHDPSKHPGDAGREVLATTELLEKILLEAPMFELFVQQRTCKTFRDTIAGSTRLQEHMFLRPIGHELPLNRRHEINPLLFSSGMLPDLTRQPDLALAQDLLTCSSLGHSRHDEATRGLVLRYASDLEKGLHAKRNQRGGLCARSPHARDIPVLPPDGSWRRMLIAQPQVRNFRMVLATERAKPEDHFHAQADIDGEPMEVTFGSLWHFVNDRYVSLLGSMIREVRCGKATSAIRRALNEKEELAGGGGGGGETDSCGKADSGGEADSGGKADSGGGKAAGGDVGGKDGIEQGD